MFRYTLRIIHKAWMGFGTLTGDHAIFLRIQSEVFEGFELVTSSQELEVNMSHATRRRGREGPQ